MAYRECPNHGWLETAEYPTAPGGHPVCPLCEVDVTGYYPTRMSDRRRPGGPNHDPRGRFVRAHKEFMARTEDMDHAEYQDAYPVMEDYEP